MKFNIPREMLWEDKKTMDEMLDRPLFNVLHEAFLSLEKEPMLFPMNELDILNEVGYQVTRLCSESRFGMEPDMEQFTREVFAKTGIKDHAMTVISLVHAVVNLVNFPPLNISKQTKRELSKINKDSWCRRLVDSFIKRVINEGCIFDEKFLPLQRGYRISDVVEERDLNDYCMSAEPSFEELQDTSRRFTLDEIVNYAKENLSLDKSAHIQNMLFNLLVVDGTREEREKVASITSYILNRDRPRSTYKEVVLQKQVGTEIHNVEAGGTGVNNEIKKD